MPLKNLPTNLLNPICLSGIILIFYFYSFLFLFSYILNYNFVSTSFFFISSISSLSSAPLFFISQFCSIFHSISSVHLFFYSFFFHSFCSFFSPDFPVYCLHCFIHFRPFVLLLSGFRFHFFFLKTSFFITALIYQVIFLTFPIANSFAYFSAIFSSSNLMFTKIRVAT